MKSGVVTGGDAPAYTAVAVTPDDDVIMSCRALWVGGAGNLTVEMEGAPNGETVVFQGVKAGVWMPIRVRKVMEATTATLIVAVG